MEFCQYIQQGVCSAPLEGNVHHTSLSLCVMLVDKRLQTLLVGSLQPLNLETTLEQNESGHGLDAIVLSSVCVLIHVHLVEDGIGVGFSQLPQKGDDSHTGGAPAGEEVYHHESVPGLFQYLVELISGFYLLELDVG